MSLVQTAELAVVIRAKDEASAAFDKIKGSAGGLGADVFKAAAVAGAALIGLGGASVAMASKFDDAMRQVETQGGISAAAMEALKQPVLNLSVAVGTSATALAGALMPIAAEGYKGADAMKVLNIAAIGAKVGNADLMTTTNALTTAMKDYNLPAKAAKGTMDMLLTATASGRTSFQDLAGSIATVMPQAAAFHIPMAAVLGQLTAMTSQGVPAAVAAHNISREIGNLVAPTSKAQKEFALLHLSSKDLVATMTSGPTGLVTAVEKITEAVGKKYPAGSAAYDQAMKASMGNIQALQAALTTTGVHFKDTINATNGLAHASDGAGYTMDKWKNVQGEFSVQMDKAKAAVSRIMIEIGERLMPVMSTLIAFFVGSVVPTLQRFADMFTAQILPIIIKVWQFITTYLVPVLLRFTKGLVDVGVAAIATTRWIIDHWQALLPVFLIVAAALAPIVVGFIAAKVQAGIAAVQSAAAWVIANATMMAGNALRTTLAIAGFVATGVGAVIQAGLTSAAWVGSAVVATAAWAANRAAVLAGWAVQGAIWLGMNAMMVGTAIATGIAAAAAFLLPLAPFILIGAAVAALVAFVVINWGKISSVTKAVFGDIGAFLSGIFSTIGAIAGGVFSAIGSAINNLLGPLKGVLGLVGNVAGFLGNLVTGKHAEGGYFTAPHIAMIAESGPEWVINQKQAGPFAPMLNAMVGAGGVGAVSGGTSGGGSVAAAPAAMTVLYNTITLDGRVVGQSVTRYQGQQARLQGMSAGAR